MNALFLKDLADKTRRGLRGRIQVGRSAGGRAFGYSVVRELDAHGAPVRGKRVIDDAEAEVIRRIFSSFAEGDSPIAIAKVLNAERVSGPDGRAWRDTTIRGHALRGTGILRNEMYVGRLVWNRMRYMKDPTTGRRVSRMNRTRSGSLRMLRICASSTRTCGRLDWPVFGRRVEPTPPMGRGSGRSGGRRAY